MGSILCEMGRKARSRSGEKKSRGAKRSDRSPFQSRDETTHHPWSVAMVA
jgi:hypothetical protein